MDGYLTTLLVAHNSYPLKISKIVAVHPSVTDQSIGIVVVVEALKSKVGYHGVIDIVHDMCMCVGVCMLQQLTNFCLLSRSRT